MAKNSPSSQKLQKCGKWGKSGALRKDRKIKKATPHTAGRPFLPQAFLFAQAESARDHLVHIVVLVFAQPSAEDHIRVLRFQGIVFCHERGVFFRR